MRGVSVINYGQHWVNIPPTTTTTTTYTPPLLPPPTSPLLLPPARVCQHKTDPYHQLYMNIEPTPTTHHAATSTLNLLLP